MQGMSQHIMFHSHKEMVKFILAPFLFKNVDHNPINNITISIIQLNTDIVNKA